MALRSLKPDGTEGTATLEVTYKNGKEIIKRYGCMVKNDANLEFLIQKHINEKADKTKFKDPKCYAYMYDPDFKEERNEATVRVSCHRFSMPSQPKECTLDSSPHNFVKVQGHIFCPCGSEYFNNSKYFLKEHSKEILVAQDLTQVIFGLTYDKEKKSPKFIPLKLDHRLSSNAYGIGAEDYKKLEDAGPVLLQDNKTVVGSLKKRGNNEISISIFGNNQEITTTSSTDGAPGDGTGQAAATLPSAPVDEDEDEDDVAELHKILKEFYRLKKRLDEERRQRELKEQKFDRQKKRLDEERRQRELKEQKFDRQKKRLDEVKYLLRLYIEEHHRHFKLLCSKIDGEGSFHGSEDLADRWNAPPLIKAKCKRNTAHSPALELMQLPKVSSLPVNVLVKNLKAISRYDVADPIEKEIPENERKCHLNVALNRYKRLFKGVASRLDEETRNNWKTLGSEFGLQGDELKQTESNPAKRFLEHVYATMESGELTVKRLLQLLKTIETPSIRNLLKDWGITRQDNSRSIKDVIPPDSEIMWRLCLELNKSKAVGGMKKWEHLALSWGIKPEMYSQFDPSQKTSPTEILLRWLVVERPDFTVNELCYHLGEIGYHDAKGFLEEKLKGWPLQKEVYV